MQNLLLSRFAFKPSYTIGRLFLDGVYICDTIEDTDRRLTSQTPLDVIRAVKVKAETAIPKGTYKVTLDVVSPRFSQKEYYRTFCGGKLPRLLNVPGFDGILMHRGRTQNDSAGCIILGYNKVVGQVTDSQKAFEKLYNLLKGNKDIQITIQ